MRHPNRCQHDVGRGEYVACREPAHWEYEGIELCERHCIEVLRSTSYDVYSIIDGDAVGLDDSGEIERVA